MEVVHAPEKYHTHDDIPIVFLAGSIEMGEAEDWQQELIDRLSDKHVRILNPRRPDWDSSWEQVIENEQFREQVEWELDGLDACDFLFMYFDPKTQSPISLMELGLHANTTKKMVVCCPEGFHRKGNVDIVCEKYNVACTDSLDEAIAVLRVSLGKTKNV